MPLKAGLSTSETVRDAMRMTLRRIGEAAAALRDQNVLHTDVAFNCFGSPPVALLVAACARVLAFDVCAEQVDASMGSWLSLPAALYCAADYYAVSANGPVRSNSQ